MIYYTLTYYIIILLHDGAELVRLQHLRLGPLEHPEGDPEEHLPAT